jgi:hypothetical protein
MPSDPRVTTALEALARPIAEFRTALAGALQQAESILHAEAASAPERSRRLAAELGPFAEARIDAQRFASVFGTGHHLPAEVTDRLRRAVAVIGEVLAEGDDLFTVGVQPPALLGEVVNDALARTGRAFGAILAVDLLRSGRFVPDEHDDLFQQLSFLAWTRTERRYAPPLVVRLSGADLQASQLAPYLDGREKLVLVVDPPCPPAPLVRLITPGTLVVQTADGRGLDLVATADGPAIAALVPEGAATFLHDPRLGNESWQRLGVWSVPGSPRRAIGAWSTWQMQEDLRQLQALAAAPIGAPLPADAAAAAGSPDAVDRLASWLLRQSGLAGNA